MMHEPFLLDRGCNATHGAHPAPFVSQVEIEDIRRVYGLFVDVKRSTQFLMEYQKVGALLSVCLASGAAASDPRFSSGSRAVLVTRAVVHLSPPR